jgi:transcription-repair coupling factor (superfamily II helicase)
VASTEAIRRVANVDGATLAVAKNAQAIALAALSHASEDLVVAIVPTQAEAESIAHDLHLLLGDVDAPGEVGAPISKVELFGAWDTLPLERVSPELTTMGRRSALRWRLEHGTPPDIVVAPIRALLQRLTPRCASPVVLRKGATIDLEELIENLVALGYRREPQVEHRGEFAVRGGIVDIFGSTIENPVRLDLFGDDIDRRGSKHVGSILIESMQIAGG